MAKMMAVQIEHARSRVKQITAEKLGQKPEPKTTSPSRDEFSNMLRSGEHTPTGPALKKALNAVVTKQEFTHLKDFSTRYSAPADFQRTTQIATTIDEALYLIHTEKTRNANTDEFLEIDRRYKHTKAILHREAQSVEDAIVLGDQQAALMALEKFAEFQV